jgi:hypothetical protein
MTTTPAQDRGDEQFSAKLLFQFRIGRQRHSQRRRLCEERIVQLQASSSKVALTIAKRKGRTAQHSYRNIDGEMVRFEFVGVMDLLHLGPCEEGEVWFEFTRRLSPMERRHKLIPPDSELLSRLPNAQEKSSK